MSAHVHKLIHRLQEKACDGELASDELAAPIPPPVSPRTVDATERQLGFPLPELLRQLYLEIGNGGFGPSYGVLGLKGGATDEQGNTLVGVYRSMKRLARESRHWHWPEGLLPLCRLGCGMYSCLDCARVRVPVLIFDPNILGQADETDKKDAVLLWTYAFFWQDSTFTSWLKGWLDERPERDPTRPSASWLRQRLRPDNPENARMFLKGKAKAIRRGEQ
jgi:hypothetical protein